MLDLEMRGEDLQRYRQSLQALYGDETVETARQCLAGQQAFHGINTPRQDPFHRSLVDAYAKAWTKRDTYG
jgi:hypothetical protein